MPAAQAYRMRYHVNHPAYPQAGATHSIRGLGQHAASCFVVRSVFVNLDRRTMTQTPAVQGPASNFSACGASRVSIQKSNVYLTKLFFGTMPVNAPVGGDLKKHGDEFSVHDVKNPSGQFLGEARVIANCFRCV